MARVLTFEEYLEFGLTEEQANKAVAAQSEPKPRVSTWITNRITEDRAAEVNEAFPDVNLHKKVWKKQSKKK